MSDVQQRIDSLVKGHKVVLFMKGTAQFPQCGFSGRAMQILKACNATDITNIRLRLHGDKVQWQLRDAVASTPWGQVAARSASVLRTRSMGGARAPVTRRWARHTPVPTATTTTRASSSTTS